VTLVLAFFAILSMFHVGSCVALLLTVIGLLYIVLLSCVYLRYLMYIALLCVYCCLT
jgi:hypothetical protein